MARITAWIEAFALSVGGPGLFVIAFLDSSFLSFPEVNDLLIVRPSFNAAGEVTYDLRNIVYAHLSRMSFSFYDRVQSGQVISRANSDIRSVQIFLAFAPERVNPGDAHFGTRNTTKLIGGMTPACRDLATALYNEVAGVRR